MTSNRIMTNDLYAEFPAEVRQELAKYEQVTSAETGTKLLQRGASVDHLIILNSGSAETSVVIAGKPLSLGVDGAGKVFGLHSVISGTPPDTNVTCLEQCEVMRVPKSAFLDVLRSYPQMYFAVVKVLSSDLAAVNRVIRNYARGSAARAQLKCGKSS